MQTRGSPGRIGQLRESVVWAGDDEEVVVAGTLDALSELADPAGAPAELNRALARVRDACR